MNTKIVGLLIVCVFAAMSKTAEGSIPSTCSLPLVAGPCRASIPRWGYKTEDKKCVTFIYGGCNPNENNYETEEACQNACVS